jgi:uncharacterized membrane protein (DUF4010 family)
MAGCSSQWRGGPPTFEGELETVELLQRFSVALAIGLLIGLERGWQARGEAEGERAAGLRTLALSALLGAVWGAVANRFGGEGSIALGLAFVIFGAAIVLFRFREISHDETFGATTAVAAMLTFALGAYAMLGDIEVAAAAGVVATGLLALKAFLHAWVQRLTWPELRSGIVLLAMAFILPPLLPNRAVDPWRAVNPYEIWLFTVLIAAISFLGYVAVKAAGDKIGIAIAGLVGGLASSTAVTATMSHLAREYPERTPLLSAGALLANAVMIARVLAIVALVDFSLVGALLAPLALAAGVLAGGGMALMLRAMSEPSGGQSIDLKNPLDLSSVLKFGALLTVVMAVAKIATNVFGDAGLYGLAAISGVADVDAITLSVVRLAREGLDAETGAKAIAIAVAANTLSKTAFAWFVGGAALGWRLALFAGLAIAAGVAGILFVPSLRT